MKTIKLFLLFILITNITFTQTTYYEQDFEGDTTDWVLTPIPIEKPKSFNYWVHYEGNDSKRYNSIDKKSLQVLKRANNGNGNNNHDAQLNINDSNTLTASRTFNFDSITTGPLFFNFKVFRNSGNLVVKINDSIYTIPLQTSTPSWLQHTIDLTNYIHLNSVEISFIYVSNGNEYGPRIDNISISSFLPLPIELISFSASNKDNKTILEWITGSEINNDKFIIEKSRDLKNWIIVDTVFSKGNSNTFQKYSLIDNSWNGITYYRLKQIDFNGDTKIFNTISNMINKDNDIVLNKNPNDGNFSLDISVTSINEYTIIITDILGNKLNEKTSILNVGNHNILYNLDLPNGNYLIYIIVNNETTTKRFIIYK